MKTATVRFLIVAALVAMLAACSIPSLQPEGGVVNPIAQPTTAPAVAQQQPIAAQPTQPVQPTMAAPTPTTAPIAVPTEAAQQAIVLDSSGVTTKTDHLYTWDEINAMPDGAFVRGGANPFDTRFKSSGIKWVDAHQARLVYLEENFVVRNGDVPTWASAQAWMQAAGFNVLSPIKEARQYEEENIPYFDTTANGLTKVVLSGIQLDVTNIEVVYPASISTDRAFYLFEDGRALQPDPQNMAHLFTNGGLNDQLTAWGSSYNWPNLMTDGFGPDKNPWTAAQQAYNPSDATTPLVSDNANATAAASCPDYNGFAALGQINQTLVDKGIPSGVQMTFNADWTPPAGCVEVIQLNGAPVDTAPADQMVSVWMAQANRPLAGAQ